MERVSKCKNFNLCRNFLGQFTIGNMCFSCISSFGEIKNILKEYPNSKCPICSKQRSCFKQPNFECLICSSCFRTIYFGELPDR